MPIILQFQLLHILIVFPLMLNETTERVGFGYFLFIGVAIFIHDEEFNIKKKITLS